MLYEEILYDVQDGVAVVTMNRPDRLNAMTLTMGGEIRHAMQTATDDVSVKAIVLTGAGRGFCAGADAARLQKRSSGTTEEIEPLANAGAISGGLSLPTGYDAKYSYLATVPKPLIAAVNGAAVGVGLVMALWCDLRFAGSKAKFGTAFTKRGLVAEYGSAWLLPRLIGPSKALDLLYSARIVEAGEALTLGLVDRLDEDIDPVPAAMAYARQLVDDVSPRSTRIMKQLVYRAMTTDVTDAVADAERETAAALKSEDFKEGIAAWQEKRPANFPGR